MLKPPRIARSHLAGCGSCLPRNHPIDPGRQCGDFVRPEIVAWIGLHTKASANCSRTASGSCANGNLASVRRSPGSFLLGDDPPGMLRLWQVWRLGRSNLGWNDERGRNPFVQGRKSGIVCLRQLRQMAVGGLPPALYPMGKPGDVVIVGDELERHRSLSLESHQERPRLSHSESIVRSLRQNANEPQLRDGACE